MWIRAVPANFYLAANNVCTGGVGDVNGCSAATLNPRRANTIAQTLEWPALVRDSSLAVISGLAYYMRRENQSARAKREVTAPWAGAGGVQYIA